MATNILRKIDRWRFEMPLALLLGLAGGFAVIVMPADLFGAMPVAGAMGMKGRLALAVMLALLLAAAAYLLLRRPARRAASRIRAMRDARDAEVAGDAPPVAAPAGRLVRVRRADAHPDAPPREPIIASRDLGEPFMDAGAGDAPPAVMEGGEEEASGAEAMPAADEGEPWWPESVSAIPDGEYVELAGEEREEDVADDAAAAWAVPPALVPEPPAPEPPVPEPVAFEPVVPAAREAPAGSPPELLRQEEPASHSVPPQRESIAAMMERLSAGLERRRRGAAPSGPMRDMRPALRDALEELNRIAERHG